MTGLFFTRLSEYNDHEGEKWNWWLQTTDNEEEIYKLAKLLRDAEAHSDFELDFQLHMQDVEPESVVDKLVQYADSGYNRSNNKVVGKFTCPDSFDENLDELYKGGINRYFQEDAV